MRKTKTALLTALLGATWTATTLAAVTFTIVRLTDSAGCSMEPTTSANGKRIAFLSEADLVPGGNADGNFELYLRDQKKGLTQITTTTGADIESPAISKNGARVVFVSTHDLVAGGNADGNREVFLFDKKTGLSQVTTTTGCNNFEPAIGSSGKQLAFTSTCGLVTSNADASQDLYLLDEKKGLTQVTNGAADTDFAQTPALSNNGARVAFTSNLDLVSGDNADLNYEIFLFDKKKGLRQVTTTTGCSVGSPVVSASGTRMALTSSCDLVPGSNVDGATQIFTFDVKKGFTQLTQAPGMTASDAVQLPAINATGSRVAFYSSHDLVPGGNPDGNFELFLFAAKKGLVQVTTSTGGQGGVGSRPALSANGKRIVFEMNSELAPDANTDGEGEIYVADQD